MNPTLNQLIQVQELSFARSEQRAANPATPLTQLEEALDELIKKLPPEISHRYQQLERRSAMVVAPILRHGCSGCGMALPVALVNDVRGDERVQACPHCGRFLYLLQGLPHRAETAPVEKSAVRAGIGRFSDLNLMVPKLSAKTRDEAISELAHVMASHKYIEDPAALVELALRREAMVSTAVEHGLAFPHVRNVEGGSLAVALGLKPAGLQFQAPDRHLTRIVFFIVIPTAASAFYLRLLAGLVKTFATAEARQNLLQCEKPDPMWKVLTTLTRGTIP